MTLVKIENIALGQLLASTYGVKKAEVDGILSGSVIHNNGNSEYTVAIAHPLQLVRRGPQSLTTIGNEDRRVGRVLGSIGEFHSHVPHYKRIGRKRVLIPAKVTLSSEDIKSIKKFYPSGIEIVVALNSARRAGSYIIAQHSISGYFQDGKSTYRFDIGAYYLEGNQKRRANLFVRDEDMIHYFKH